MKEPNAQFAVGWGLLALAIIGALAFSDGFSIGALAFGAAGAFAAFMCGRDWGMAKAYLDAPYEETSEES